MRRSAASTWQLLALVAALAVLVLAAAAAGVTPIVPLLVGVAAVIVFCIRRARGLARAGERERDREVLRDRYRRRRNEIRDVLWGGHSAP